MTPLSLIHKINVHGHKIHRYRTTTDPVALKISEVRQVISESQIIRLRVFIYLLIFEQKEACPASMMAVGYSWYICLAKSRVFSITLMCFTVFTCQTDDRCTDG